MLSRSESIFRIDRLNPSHPKYSGRPFGLLLRFEIIIAVFQYPYTLYLVFLVRRGGVPIQITPNRSVLNGPGGCTQKLPHRKAWIDAHFSYSTPAIHLSNAAEGGGAGLSQRRHTFHFFF